MTESYSLSETIGTSDESIPDFATLLMNCTEGKVAVQRSVTDQELVSACKVSERFYDIIVALGFRPILMELAVINDQRLLVERRQFHNAPPPAPFFVSSIISFRDSQRQAPFLRAWDSALKRILHPNGGIKPVVPHPETYEKAYFVEPLNSSVQWVRQQLLAANRLQRRTQAPRFPEGFIATQSSLRDRVLALDRSYTEFRKSDYSEAQERSPDLPAIHQARYSFEPLEANPPTVTKSIAALAAGFSWSLVEEISSTDSPESLNSVLDSLEYAHLLVVPFRRPMVSPVASLRADGSRVTRGDEPGGCLFVVVEPRLAQAAPTSNLEDMAIRLSWMLFRAALREAHAEIEIRKSQADALPVVSHFLPTEIATAKHATAKLRESLQDLPVNQALVMTHVDTVEALLKRLDWVASFAIGAWKVTEGITPPGRPNVTTDLSNFAEHLLKECRHFWGVLRRVRERFLDVPDPFQVEVEDLNAMAVSYETNHVSVIANELVNNIIKHAEESSSTAFLIRIVLKGGADGRFLHMVATNAASSEKLVAAQVMIRAGGKVGLRTMAFANTYYSLPVPSFRADEAQGLFTSDIPVGELSSQGQS